MTIPIPACCEQMRNQLTWACADHSCAGDCPDALVGQFGAARRYGLYIHDGGRAFIEIQYCPWCGSRLSSAVPDGS